MARAIFPPPNMQQRVCMRRLCFCVCACVRGRMDEWIALPLAPPLPAPLPWALSGPCRQHWRVAVRLFAAAGPRVHLDQGLPRRARQLHHQTHAGTDVLYVCTQERVRGIY